MLLNLHGIVMRRTKYGEGSLIVDLLTEEYGLLTTIVQGLKSKSGRARDALLQLGNIVELVIYYKPSGNMHRLKSAQTGEYLKDIPYNFIKGSVLLFCIELARNALIKSGVDGQHFVLLRSEIIKLDRIEKELAFFPLRFTLLLSNSLGFGIDWTSYEDSYLLDLSAGRFVQNIPNHPYYLSAYYAKQYYILGIQDPSALKIKKNDRQYLLEQSMLFFKLQIDQFKSPNSLEILTTIFKS